MTRIALDRVGAYDVKPRAKVANLPLSKRQLVEIAKAVASRPKVLVLDEPTASLSAVEKKTRLLPLLRELKGGGCAIIYISHLLPEVFEISDTVSVLRDGHLVFEGATQEVSDAELMARMIGREMLDILPQEALPSFAGGTPIGRRPVG